MPDRRVGPPLPLLDRRLFTIRLMAARQQTAPSVGRNRLGGTDGNELLTSAVAIVLTLLLAAEGITLIDLRGLRGPHMFIGMLLIPPVLVKLASTGYRFARYYTGARPYRAKGPPVLALRLLAPLLVLSTIGVLASGVALLAVGHRSDPLMLLHKATFIVWAGCFGVHFLAYLPRVARSLGSARTAGRRRPRGGALRLTLVAASAAGGVVLALAVVSAIGRWQGYDG